MTPHERLLKIIRLLPRVTVHNKLMTAVDREIALTMMYMEDPEREYVLSFVSAEKKKRIREELKLHERLTIKYDQYLSALDHVVSLLKNSDQNRGFKSYIRPRRYKSRGE